MTIPIRQCINCGKTLTGKEDGCCTPTNQVVKPTTNPGSRPSVEEVVGEEERLRDCLRTIASGEFETLEDAERFASTASRLKGGR